LETFKLFLNPKAKKFNARDADIYGISAAARDQEAKKGLNL